MTPKEEYEARKAERAKLANLDHEIRNRTEQVMLLDMLDRFTTAVERIADALETKDVPLHLRPGTRWNRNRSRSRWCVHRILLRRRSLRDCESR